MSLVLEEVVGFYFEERRGEDQSEREREREREGKVKGVGELATSSGEIF